ncbi:MAG: hypothetical protein K5839_07075, partial [Treponemataceae bacterium]|nr:hypothetical protein [Treponemataceae bacterium]
LEEPDFVELNAIGSILHSYYNGLESIFCLIYKSLENKSLAGNMWHTDLFTYTFSATDTHKQILSDDLKNDLKEYLGFRHVFRHSYGYELDWTRLYPLFAKLSSNWQVVKKQIQNFLEA